MQCEMCQKELKGKQVKWCSQSCKNKESNTKHLNYQAQKRRRLERKKKLVLLKGGCCSKCGYDKSLRALSFHHRNPEEKEFALSARELTMYKEERLLNEAHKCDLLCANCHMEEHASEEMMDWK